MLRHRLPLHSAHTHAHTRTRHRQLLVCWSTSEEQVNFFINSFEPGDHRGIGIRVSFPFDLSCTYPTRKTCQRPPPSPSSSSSSSFLSACEANPAFRLPYALRTLPLTPILCVGLFSLLTSLSFSSAGLPSHRTQM